MSGIFGFISRLDHKDNGQILRAFSGWHKQYGETGKAEMLSAGSGIGAQIEHFSDAIDRPEPILQTADGRYAVVDALLFNREELLPMLGEPVNSRLSDEELLLRLYELGGAKQLRAVNGDFAMAVFDKSLSRVQLIRGHLGIRPLYCYTGENLLAFATDVRAVETIYGVKPELNEERFYILATNQFQFSMHQTLFRNVYCVGAGSETTLFFEKSHSSRKEKLYWKPGCNRIRYRSQEEYQKEMRRLAEDAIDRRVKAMPGKIGAELSGGMDSSVIDLMLSQKNRPCVFAGWYDVPEDWPPFPGDERDVIRTISEITGVPCTYMPEFAAPIGNDDAPVNPDGYGSAIANVSRFMKEQGSRCVFTGQGGDEGISHRNSRLELLRYGELGHFLKEMWDEQAGEKHRVYRFVRKSLGQILVAYPRMMLGLDQAADEIDQLTPAFSQKMKGTKGNKFMMPYDPVYCLMHGGITHRAQLCAYLSAPYGVRYLFPYEDYRVMDYALSIPRHLYRAPGQNRVIYRKAFEDLMPEVLKQVDYKDVPSMREKTFMTDQEKELYDSVYQKLDRAFWAPYLNMETMDKLHDQPMEDLPKKEFHDCARKKSLYITCYYVQDLMQRGLEWALRQA